MTEKPTPPGWLPSILLLGLALGALYVLGVLLWPFLPAIVTSAVLATLIYPIHLRLGRWIPNRDVAALVVTVLVFFLILVPALALSAILVGEIRSGIDLLAELVREGLPEGRIAETWTTLAGYLGLEGTDFGDTLAGQLRNFIGLLARRTLRFLSGLGGWLLQGGAALFTLFYLLRDGEGLLGTVKWYIPLDPPATDRLVRKARDVIFATVYGSVIVAIVQGSLGGLAFLVVDLPAAALWGTVMTILSLLPVVGAPLIWGPAGVLLILDGALVRGIGLLIFGSLVISTVDNYLRAVLVGGRTQLHPLVVFFSVLGGLVVFGAVGIFVGPVLFVVALALVEMARLALGESTAPIPEAGRGR